MPDREVPAATGHAPALNPTLAHANKVEALINKLADTKLVFKEETQTPAAGPNEKVPETPAAAEAALAAEVDKSALGEPPAAAEATPATETPVAEPPPAAKPAKLARSLEIQRRAAQAAARAKEQLQKLKAPAAETPAAAPAKPAAPAQDDIAAERARLEQMRTQLEAQIRLVKDDPLEFARQRGVTGEALASFVRNGADPTVRALENLRREAGQAIQAMKEEHKRDLAALQAQFVAGQEETAQRNFFQFVEEAKAANPAAFPAISSGVIYSEADMWQKANELLESRADLRDDFDEDKLLTAVEQEARKDPRWGRLQKLLKPAAQTSQQQQSKAQPEKKSKEEPVRAAPTRPAPTRDPLSGQFVERHQSPNERQALRVERLIQRVQGRLS